MAALSREAETGRIQEWLAKQEAGGLAISEWVRTEFSSALAIKLRSGQIGAAHRSDALAAFARLAADSFVVLPIRAWEFRVAAGYVDQHSLGLRAGDALHLAICADQGAALCTLDRRLAEAGAAMGVKTVRI